MKAFLLILVSVAVVSAKPTGEDDVIGSVIGVVRSCAEEDVSLCLKVCAVMCFEGPSFLLRTLT